MLALAKAGRILSIAEKECVPPYGRTSLIIELEPVKNEFLMDGTLLA